MKKLALILAVAFTMVSATTTFAHEKEKGAVCKSGKACCKKTKTANVETKAKCKKMCADKDKKAA